MLQRIETSEVMKRAMKYFDEHNEQCPIMEVVSRRKTGVIMVKRRVGIIPESVTTTFYTILSQYVHDYNRTCSIMPAGMYTMQDLPPMHATNRGLAKYCRCTDKTVYNHIVRMRELNLVTTKFHGDKKAFELWINPKFLFSAAQLAESGTPQNTPEIALKGENAKIFLHNSTYREIFEKEKGNADMFISDGESIQGQKGRAEGGTLPLNESVEQQREDQAGGAARIGASKKAAENDKNRRQRATSMLEARMPSMPKGLDRKYWQMLINFWLYSWKVIYPNREFSKDQQEKALVAISKGVFNHFIDQMNDKEWSDYYQFQMAKVDKAGRYYDNHPDAYKPDPYAVVVPGKGYFDYENVRGFVGIDAWVKKDSIKNARTRQAYADKQAEKVMRCETLLRTARRDFEKIRLNMKPRKEVDGKDQIGLFQYYNVIFTGMGAKWQEAFCTQFLNQKARDFQPPKYMRPKRLRQMADQKPATIVTVEDWMSDISEGYYTE